MILHREALSNSDFMLFCLSSEMVQRCINSCQNGAAMYQQLSKWCSHVSTAVKMIQRSINKCQNDTAMYQQLSKWYSDVSTAVKIPILTAMEFLTCSQDVTNASCAKGLC